MTDSNEKIDNYGYMLAIGSMAQAVLLFNQQPEMPSINVKNKVKKWQTNLLFESRKKKRPQYKSGTLRS
jgi:hypothetical protein